MEQCGLEETEKRYNQICNEIADREERTKALLALFGTVDRSAEFFKWRRESRLAKKSVTSKPVLPEPKEFILAIESVDFTSLSQIGRLTELLSMHYTPYIPMGSLRGVPLRLYPITYMLCNDSPTDYNVPDSDQLLPEVFLGVSFDNTSVTDTSDHDGSDSDKEHKSPGLMTGSLPTPPSGLPDGSIHPLPNEAFVFYQLGRLEYYPSTTSDLKQETLISEDWVDTNFIVVIKLLQDGTKDGIYLIYNDNGICDCGDRHNLDAPNMGGYLPSKYDFISKDDPEYGDEELDDLVDNRLLCASLAAKFGDFAHGKEIQVKRLDHKKVKCLARVVRTSEGKFIMQGD